VSGSQNGTQRIVCAVSYSVTDSPAFLVLLQHSLNPITISKFYFDKWCDTVDDEWQTITEKREKSEIRTFDSSVSFI
jgi:hypothetical protein